MSTGRRPDKIKIYSLGPIEALTTGRAGYLSRITLFVFPVGLLMKIRLLWRRRIKGDALNLTRLWACIRLCTTLGAQQSLIRSREGFNIGLIELMQPNIDEAPCFSRLAPGKKT